ncbi:MAG: enoyl-CoA hydratase/isomerase family protein [Chloroflexi bacterium]|nr:enoyl-CoA hydratase/isomerase family protein [Chloroflexota bacterium]
MEEKHAIFTKEENIGILTMNRPSRLNALSARMMDEMREAVEAVKADREVRALIITGAGRGFCAGADVKGMGESIEARAQQGAAAPRRGRAIHYREGYTHRFCLSLMGLEKPVIAAVNGPAVGGGCDIALMCDIRIASDKALFGEFYARRGILADEGGIYLLPQAVGMSWAAELLFTGESIDAAQAEHIGLVNRVVNHEKLLDTARELAIRIAKMPPLAVQMAKRALYWRQRVSEFERSLHYAVSVSDLLFQTEDHKEGVRAFLEKREPHYKGE